MDTLKTGWLLNKSGEKFAPKTLLSQVSTDDGILLEQKLEDDLTSVNNNIEKLKNNTDTSCMIIAHRGYHVNSYQNTIQSFKEAIVNGFKYLEVDVRKTLDGTYVLSHDATVTLYKDGVAQQVEIAASTYSNIKSYTWDENGKYPINTLHALFNSMKVYDVVMICDLKDGYNYEIVQIAHRCNATNRLLLSYSSFSNALLDKSLLNSFSDIPIRVIPSDYNNFRNFCSQINNRIYADINASMEVHRNTYLNYALSIGIPILFSGCSLSNKNVWAQIASGCMSNDNDNISYSEFKDAISGQYGAVSELTTSVEELEIELQDGTVTITANTDLDDISGYIYAYSDALSTAEIKQTTFGNSVSISIIPKQVGGCPIVIFDGNGNRKWITVDVVNTYVGDYPQLGVQTVATFDKGCSINGTDLKMYKNANRMAGLSTLGSYPLYEGNNVYDGNRYPFEIPEGATNIIITCDDYIPGLMFMNYDADSGYYTKVLDSGWQTANSATYDLTTMDCKFVAINFKNSSNTTIGDDADTSGIVIEFT